MAKLSKNPESNTSAGPSIFKIVKGEKIPIHSEKDWERLGKPASDKHWKEGRSACETARSWLAATPPDLPAGIGEMLEAHPHFGRVVSWQAEPEVKLPFDSLAGNTRNTDLLVEAEDAKGRFLIAVEAKADESFGLTVAEQLASALEARIANPRSQALTRIQQLAESLFGPRGDKEPGKMPALKDIRYQLLTATAGALAEAQRCRMEWKVETIRVVVIIQEFATSETKPEKRAANVRDLDRFVPRLTRGHISSVKPGQLLGPLPLSKPRPGIDLFIGKVVAPVST